MRLEQVGRGYLTLLGHDMNSLINVLGVVLLFLGGCSLTSVLTQEVEGGLTTASGTEFDSSEHRVATFRMW